MKLQLVTAAAALLVASAAALPAPYPDSQGLVPDVDDGPIELIETRDIADSDGFVDDGPIEVLETRTDTHGLIPDTDDWEEEDSTIEVLETRDISDTVEERRDNGPHVALGDRDVSDGASPVDDELFEELSDEGADESVEKRDVSDDAAEPVADEPVEELEARDIPNSEVLEARAKTISEAAANFNFTGDFDFALDRLLAEIDEIPDEVLEKGDEALHQWLVEHGSRSGSEKLKRDAEDQADYENLSLLERGELIARASWWKIAKCVAAIVQLLATTAVPAAKLLRIKSYIKALGGTKQAVKLLLGATTKAEKLKAGGEALVLLSAELLGISTVKNNCF